LLDPVCQGVQVINELVEHRKGTDLQAGRAMYRGTPFDQSAFSGGGRLVWQVDGQNGENLIRADGASQVEAWHRAVEQAEALGMLGRSPAVQAGPPLWAGPVQPSMPPALPAPPPGRRLSPRTNRGVAVALVLIGALLVAGILADPAAAWVAFGFAALFVVILAGLALEANRPWK